MEILTTQKNILLEMETDDFLFPLYSYWANLKLWFKHKISKEEFDIEARRLLAQENGKKSFIK